eukprot:m.144711 g.144711  ORF g.144711 m.144711 type:complete len:68 (-) comp16772_c4_seq2:761-964(-)
MMLGVGSGGLYVYLSSFPPHHITEQQPQPESLFFSSECSSRVDSLWRDVSVPVACCGMRAATVGAGL